MKKLVALLLATLICGCAGHNDAFDKAMQLRTSLLSGQGCRFEAVVTADFGEQSTSFSLQCEADRQGELTFTVVQPQTLSGIAGRVDAERGTLCFADTALTFPLLADGLLSPVSGAWVLVNALRSGYVRSCAEEGNLVRLTVDDSYQADALMLDIWIDGTTGPVQADIYEENRRILTVQIENFALR